MVPFAQFDPMSIFVMCILDGHASVQLMPLTVANVGQGHILGVCYSGYLTAIIGELNSNHMNGHDLNLAAFLVYVLSVDLPASHCVPERT